MKLRKKKKHRRKIHRNCLIKSHQELTNKHPQIRIGSKKEVIFITKYFINNYTDTFKSTRTKSYMIPSRVDVFKAKSLENVDFKYKLLKKLDEKNKWDEEFFN